MLSCLDSNLFGGKGETKPPAIAGHTSKDKDIVRVCSDPDADFTVDSLRGKNIRALVKCLNRDGASFADLESLVFDIPVADLDAVAEVFEVFTFNPTVTSAAIERLKDVWGDDTQTIHHQVLDRLSSGEKELVGAFKKWRASEDHIVLNENVIKSLLKLAKTPGWGTFLRAFDKSLETQGATAFLKHELSVTSSLSKLLLKQANQKLRRVWLNAIGRALANGYGNDVLWMLDDPYAMTHLLPHGDELIEGGSLEKMTDALPSARRHLFDKSWDFLWHFSNPSTAKLIHESYRDEVKLQDGLHGLLQVMHEGDQLPPTFFRRVRDLMTYTKGPLQDHIDEMLETKVISDIILELFEERWEPRFLEWAEALEKKGAATNVKEDWDVFIQSQKKPFIKDISRIGKREIGSVDRRKKVWSKLRNCVLLQFKSLTPPSVSEARAWVLGLKDMRFKPVDCPTHLVMNGSQPMAESFYLDVFMPIIRKNYGSGYVLHYGVGHITNYLNSEIDGEDIVPLFPKTNAVLLDSVFDFGPVLRAGAFSFLFDWVDLDEKMADPMWFKQIFGVFVSPFLDDKPPKEGQPRFSQAEGKFMRGLFLRASLFPELQREGSFDTMAQWFRFGQGSSRAYPLYDGLSFLGDPAHVESYVDLRAALREIVAPGNASKEILLNLVEGLVVLSRLERHFSKSFLGVLGDEISGALGQSVLDLYKTAAQVEARADVLRHLLNLSEGLGTKGFFKALSLLDNADIRYFLTKFEGKEKALERLWRLLETGHETRFVSLLLKYSEASADGEPLVVGLVKRMSLLNRTGFSQISDYLLEEVKREKVRTWLRKVASALEVTRP